MVNVPSPSPFFAGPNTVGQQPWAQRGDLEARLRALETGITGTPVGTIAAYWGATAPTGWLTCDGSTFSAGTYPQLAALLGGTTLPNLKGRVLVGIDAAQTEFTPLGHTGGSKTTTAPHTHDLQNHSHTGTTGNPNQPHTHNATNIYGTSDTAHTHYVGGPAGEGSAAPQGTGRAGSTWSPSGDGGTAHQHNMTTGGPSNNTSEASSAAATSGNLAPYTAVTIMIKAA